MMELMVLCCAVFDFGMDLSGSGDSMQLEKSRSTGTHRIVVADLFLCSPSHPHASRFGNAYLASADRDTAK